MPKLVIFHDNWSDEMDVDGWMIMSESDCVDYFSAWGEHFASIEHGDGEFDYLDEMVEIGCGTNESIQFKDYADFRNSFDIVTITDDQANMLTEMFSLTEFGFVPSYPSEIFDEDDLEDPETFPPMTVGGK